MNEPNEINQSKVWRLGRRLLGYLRAYRGLFALTILVMILLSAADRGRAYLIKPLVDKVEKREAQATCTECGAVSKAPKAEQLQRCVNCGHLFTPPDITQLIWKDLSQLGLIALALSVIIFPLKFANDYATAYISQRVILDLRNEVSDHVIKLPLRFFHSQKSGDLLSRITNDTQVMQQAVNFFFEDVFLQPFMILAALGAMIYANWILGLGVLAFFPIYAFYLGKLGRSMRKKRKKSLERLGDATESQMQTYSGIRIVKAFNREKDELAEYKAINESYFKQVMSVMRKKALAGSVVELAISLMIAGAILLGGALFLKHPMDTGSMVVFALLLAMINTPVKILTNGFNRLQESLAAAERIFEILDAPVDQPDAPDAVDLPGLGEGIEYRDVTFAYNSEPVLSDISLHARPGEVIALVGPSGAGKSTMVDLLCRFYDPQQGEIRVGGLNLRKVRRSSLLKHVAIVTQETFLFHATVAENIRYGRPEATQEEIQAAARAANIHDHIVTMEKGYDTMVGERGAKLSGGQRQRIAIARAILKNPEILILDEATSALDTENERLVQEALNHLIRTEGGRRITFVIAHRLSTVKSADRIVVLENGRIVEEGPHAGLLERGGAYAALQRAQIVD